MAIAPMDTQDRQAAAQAAAAKAQAEAAAARARAIQQQQAAAKVAAYKAQAAEAAKAKAAAAKRKPAVQTSRGPAPGSSIEVARGVRLNTNDKGKQTVQVTKRVDPPKVQPRLGDGNSIVPAPLRTDNKIINSKAPSTVSTGPAPGSSIEVARGVRLNTDAKGKQTVQVTQRVDPPKVQPKPGDANFIGPVAAKTNIGPAFSSGLFINPLATTKPPSAISTGPVPGSRVQVAAGVWLNTNNSGQQSVEVKKPQPDRFNPNNVKDRTGKIVSLTDPEGKKLVTERIPKLTTRAQTGASTLNKTKYGSPGWVKGANNYLGSREALAGDKAYLQEIATQAQIGSTRTDFTPEQRKLAADQLQWVNGQIATIDKSLQTTALKPKKGVRDPDLIQPGEKVVLGIKPTVPRVVTTTEAKLTVEQRAREQAPGVASNPKEINNPLRPLAKNDPISYAAVSLQQDHAGDSEWLDALTAGVPPARREYTQDRVKEEMGKGNVNGALSVLSTNLDATGSPAERKQLFDAAGSKTFTQNFADTQLATAIKKRDTGFVGAFKGSSNDSVANLFTDVGTYAPPEVAKLQVNSVRTALEKPGELTDILREDAMTNGKVFTGLSLTTQRADRNGGNASVDVARVLSQNVYKDKPEIYASGVRPDVAVSGLGLGVEHATEAGAASLSIAIINQNQSGPSKVLGDAAEASLIDGVKKFSTRLDVQVGDYSDSDKEALALRGTYANNFGINNVNQSILKDRLANPGAADAADAKYAKVQADGVETQQLLDSLGALNDASSADKKLQEALAPVGKDGSAAQFALGAAGGLNATSRPADNYSAPLQDYLRGQVLFGTSADVNNRTAANQTALQQFFNPTSLPPSKDPNQIRTPVQAAGNQTSVYRHVAGLYSLSGEILLSGKGMGWMWDAKVAGKAPAASGDAGVRIQTQLDAFNAERLDRWSRLLQADKGLGKELVGTMRTYLPELARAYQSGDRAAIAAATTKLAMNYPNLGAGYENLDPSKELRSNSIRAARGLMAAMSATNNGVNGSNSFQDANYLIDPAARTQAKWDAVSSTAFAVTLGLFATDSGAKVFRNLANTDLAKKGLNKAGLNVGTEGFIQRIISASTQSLVLGPAAQQKIAGINTLAGTLSKAPAGTKISPKAISQLLDAGILNGAEASALRTNGTLSQPVLDKLKVAQSLTPAELSKLAGGGPVDSGIAGKLSGAGFLDPGDAKLLTMTGKSLSADAGARLKTVAGVLPGELISGADLLWLADEYRAAKNNPDSGFQKWIPTTLVGGVVASNTASLGLEFGQAWARRQVSKAALQGGVTLGARVLALEEIAGALGPIGAVGNIAFGAGYFAYAYNQAKTKLEGGNTRYREMVQQTTGLTPQQATPLMDQSGGAFDSPSPVPGWLIGVPILGSYITGLAPKIVTGGVQPVEVLGQWAQAHPNKEGSLQAYLPTLKPDQLQTLAHITGDVADHYIPRGSSTVSKEGLAELEQRMKKEGLWSPVLDTNREVKDSALPRPDTVTSTTQEPIVRTTTVQPGDTLWDLYGGREGLDSAYRSGLLPQFDPAKEDGRF